MWGAIGSIFFQAQSSPTKKIQSQRLAQMSNLLYKLLSIKLLESFGLLNNFSLLKGFKVFNFDYWEDNILYFECTI